MSSANNALTGTRSIDRSIKLLQIVCMRQSGWRLTDLVLQSGMDDSTVCRILGRLVARRLVKHVDKRYAPGPALFEMAASLSAHHDFQYVCRTSLLKIHEETGWAARLHLRSDDQSVLIDSVDHERHPMVNDLGSRRPLLASPQGLAILIALPRLEQRIIVASNLRRLRRGYSSRPEGHFTAILKRSRENGFVLSLGEYAPGRATVSVAILEPDGLPVAAFGASGPIDEFTERNIQTALRLIKKEAAKVRLEHGNVIRHMNE